MTEPPETEQSDDNQFDDFCEPCCTAMWCARFGGCLAAALPEAAAARARPPHQQKEDEMHEDDPSRVAPLSEEK